MNKIVSILKKSWLESGLGEGDLMLLHSDVRGTIRDFLKKKIKITPLDIFNSFLETVGPSGTILFPNFDINLSNKMTFDLQNSNSKMGILTEIARKHYDSYRTKHPLLSFSVIGKKKKLFYSCDDYTGIGQSSPFDILYKNNGKIAILNLRENDSMSFYHFVEQMHDVDYRHIIDFKVSYINDKASEIKEYGYYARKKNQGVETDVENMGKILWEKKLYKGFHYNSVNRLRTIKAKDVYKETSKVIQIDKANGILYKIKTS